MTPLSFDSMSELYDETRGVDPSCLAAALDYLVERFPPRNFPRVVEPGIGTGRIAIPLAERGYLITGVDISEEMLEVLHQRMTAMGRSLPVSFEKRDVTKLPFADGQFDLAIAVHLFYFILEWRQAANEILRVVRDNGAIVLMHTGMGTEIPFLNDRYKEFCRDRGYRIPELGVKSTAEVIDYYANRGCSVETVRDRWSWTTRITLAEALSYLRRRAYSFTAQTPEDIHVAVVEGVEREAECRFGTLTTEVAVPNEIYLVNITRGKSLLAAGAR